jgi:hypothetical protein
MLLRECWKELNSIEFRKRPKSDAVKLRALQITRSSMQSFINTFEQYLMIDAIDAGWQEFKKKLQSV